MEALESIIFYMDTSKTVALSEPKATNMQEKAISLSQWSACLKDPNAIVLQFCRVSLDGGAFGEVGDVLRIDDNLKDSLGMERGQIHTREPWMYTPEERSELHSVVAEYLFQIAEVPAGEILMAVELPDQFDVFINGTKVKPNGSYYKDKAFPTYDITTHVKTGENVIRAETKEYGVLMNLEWAYVIGNFTLKKDFAICAQTPVTVGNVVEQGYPYYCGRIIYETEVVVDSDFDAAWLDFGKFDGVTATIKVNGEKVGVIGWPPYCIDLTGKLQKGANHITIEIANSLQNLLGPFGKGVNQNLVHAGSFYAEKHEVFFATGFNGKATLYLGK